jgi:hypothetical protein
MGAGEGVFSLLNDECPGNCAAMFTSGTLLFKTVNNGAAIQVGGHGIAPDQI